MAAYRCVLLGPKREVETIEEIDALTKWGARKIARETFRRSPVLWAFELWRDGTLLYRETKHPLILEAVGALARIKPVEGERVN